MHDRDHRTQDVPRLRQEIAIIGIGCRFPGGVEDPRSFRQLLSDGIDAITDIPPDRFPAGTGGSDDEPQVRFGGFLNDVDHFDADFFEISAREAVSMDPQQRWLLEVAWEALEDAGVPREVAADGRTGVFTALCFGDYERLLMQQPAARDGYLVAGSGRFSAAGRVSYSLGLRGPSIEVDTACSSSIVATHLACRSLIDGESTLALVGGANLIFLPEVHTCFSQSRMLAADGRCKFGDDRADGFVRSEGVGVLVLKRLSDAMADNDRIHATILGTAVNHGGRTGSSFVTPSRVGLADCVRDACRAAGVSPREIDYIEAHGTGTRVGDFVELQALCDVVSESHTMDDPCLVGSVKTNFGHTEAASGIAGLIKTALCLSERQIAPSLHFDTPNSEIDWRATHLSVVTRPTPWPNRTARAIAGVNAFGISGTNATAILAEPPTATASDGEGDQLPHVLCISARSSTALIQMATGYDKLLAEKPDGKLRMLDLCYSALARRTHHEHRLAVAGSSTVELRDRLQAFVARQEGADAFVGQRPPDGAPSIAFVFSGYAPPLNRILETNLLADPIFRSALDECSAAFVRNGGQAIEDRSSGGDSDGPGESRASLTTPFALQVALTKLWSSWGVKPQAVVGHGLGEVAAAHVAGVISLDQATNILLAMEASIHGDAGGNRIATVQLPWTEVAHELDAFKGRLRITAINSPTSTDVAGNTADVNELLTSLEERHVEGRLLNVDRAYEALAVGAYESKVAAAIGPLQRRPATVPIVSTLTGFMAEEHDFDEHYWERTLHEPVRFASAIGELRRQAVSVFVEIGPFGVVQEPLRECMHDRGGDGTALATTNVDGDARATFARQVAELYSLGCTISGDALRQQGGRFRTLPRYAWTKRRFWFDSAQRTQDRPTNQAE